MSLEYRLYQNDSAAGPVDYGTIIDTTAGLSIVAPAVPLSSDTEFAIRVYDTVSGLEETNVDARVRLRVDAAGLNVSGMPNAPNSLGVRATSGGGARATWGYNPGGQGGRPTGFRVYLGSPTPDYGTPVLTVPYSSGRPTFTATLPSQANGTYQVAVRAYNATGEEANAVVATFTASDTGPLPVDDLTASAVP